MPRKQCSLDVSDKGMISSFFRAKRTVQSTIAHGPFPGRDDAFSQPHAPPPIGGSEATALKNPEMERGSSSSPDFTESRLQSISGTMTTLSNPASEDPTKTGTFAHEVMASDEEESDSSSLPSFSQLLTGGSKLAVSAPSSSTMRKFILTTPRRSPRTKRRMADFSTPLSHRKKDRCRLNALAADARKDDAIESSYKRTKTTLAECHKNAKRKASESDGVPGLAHEDLLDSVVGVNEDGGNMRVKRALKRIEATAEDVRWYFFDYDNIPTRQKFPSAAISGCVDAELRNVQMRHQTFTSGFTETMISLGRKLLEEVLLWMWDDLCLEESEDLRHSYFNILKISAKEIGHVITPKEIERMYQNLGASPSAQDVTRIIAPMSRPKSSYPHDLKSLRYAIRLIGLIAKHMEHETISFSISLLLRLSADRTLFENLDLLQAYQDTLRSLCKYMNEPTWDDCSRTTAIQLFNTITYPTIRHQIVLSLPSTHPRIHSFRRRLSTIFLFNSLTHLNAPLPLPVPQYTDLVLDAPIFHPGPETSYPNLLAHIHFLSISLSDGLSPALFPTSSPHASSPQHPEYLKNRLAKPRQYSLLDPSLEATHHHDLDALVSALEDVNIPNFGEAYISRLEAKEMLTMVISRIKDTLRLRVRGKISIFDGKVEHIAGKGFMLPGKGCVSEGRGTA